MSEIRIDALYVTQIRNTMDTQDNTRYPHGKTIIKKFSTWKKGQHKSTVLQSVPGHKTQFIGKIYFEKNGEEKTYVGKSADDRQVYATAPHEFEVEKWFAQEGHRLAVERIEAEKAKLQTPAPEAPEQSEPAQAKTPVEELAAIRARNEANKEKGIDR